MSKLLVPRLDKKYPRKYRCARSTCETERGCDKCCKYRCPGCKYLRSWADGGTDSELCDTCWGVVTDAVKEMVS